MGKLTASEVLEKRRKRYHENKEKASIAQKADYYKNLARHKAYNRKQYLKNREKRLEYARQYRQNRPGLYSKYEKSRKTHDINFKLTKALRARLRMALKINSKTGSFVKDLGCSVTKLKIHLQLKFHRNTKDSKRLMSWNNYGDWHIDHIKPLSSFDLTDRQQFLKACHYTNLQPLWAADNLKKSNKSVAF